MRRSGPALDPALNDRFLQSFVTAPASYGFAYVKSLKEVTKVTRGFRCNDVTFLTNHVRHSSFELRHFRQSTLCNSVYSHSLANSQSRLTVTREILSTSAISS